MSRYINPNKIQWLSHKFPIPKNPMIRKTTASAEPWPQVPWAGSQKLTSSASSSFSEQIEFLFGVNINIAMTWRPKKTTSGTIRNCLWGASDAWRHVAYAWGAQTPSRSLTKLYGKGSCLQAPRRLARWNQHFWIGRFRMHLCMYIQGAVPYLSKLLTLGFNVDVYIVKGGYKPTV